MPVRLRIIVLSCVGAGLAAVLAWIAYASLFAAHQQERDVAIPPDDASPEEIVVAFIDALDAHDCHTAARLVTSGARDSAERWCNDVAGMTNVTTSAAFREDPRWSGHAATKQVVNVQVRFDLDWRWMRSDGSMPEGPTTWGYLLVRDSDDEPWRIFDQGLG